jgi:hypothetical protein
MKKDGVEGISSEPPYSDTKLQYEQGWELPEIKSLNTGRSVDLSQCVAG